MLESCNNKGGPTARTGLQPSERTDPPPSYQQLDPVLTERERAVLTTDRPKRSTAPDRCRGVRRRSRSAPMPGNAATAIPVVIPVPVPTA